VPLEIFFLFFVKFQSWYHLDFWRRHFIAPPLVTWFYNAQSLVEAKTNLSSPTAFKNKQPTKQTNKQQKKQKKKQKKKKLAFFELAIFFLTFHPRFSKTSSHFRKDSIFELKLPKGLLKP